MNFNQRIEPGSIAALFICYFIVCLPSLPRNTRKRRNATYRNLENGDEARAIGAGKAVNESLFNPRYSPVNMSPVNEGLIGEVTHRLGMRSQISQLSKFIWLYAPQVW